MLFGFNQVVVVPVSGFSLLLWSACKGVTCCFVVDDNGAALFGLEVVPFRNDCVGVFFLSSDPTSRMNHMTNLFILSLWSGQWQCICKLLIGCRNGGDRTCSVTIVVSLCPAFEFYLTVRARLSLVCCCSLTCLESLVGWLHCN